ncbi:MAG: hypothetical protein ACK5LC_17215 [Coprobacillaceae bacterium]
MEEGVGYVKIEVKDRYGTSTGANGINFNLKDTAIGTYTATQKVKITCTMYDDGEPIVLEYDNYLSVDVKDESVINNNLSLETRNREYVAISDDYQVQGPGLRIVNDNFTEKKNQFVEVTIDPNYEVQKVILPYDQDRITEVEYKTNLNNTIRIASGDMLEDAVNSGNGITKVAGVVISNETLGLGPNEYITYVSACMGNLRPSYTSSSSHYQVNPYANRFQVIGKLTNNNAVMEASVTVKTYGKDDAGNIVSGSESEITGKVVRVTTKQIALSTSVEDLSLKAGEKKTATFELSANYYYANMIGTSNPILYIKVPEHVSISSIKAISNVDGNLEVASNTAISEVDGAEYLKIQITGNAGSYFKGKENKITLTMDVEAGLQASGEYKWNEIAFWDLGGDTYRQYNSSGEQVQNIIELGDVLMPVINNKILTITAKNDLIVDTGLKLEGETSNRPPYNDSTEQTQKDTAVGFTLGTTGIYTVDIFNNLTTTVESVTTYIPVPKLGNNFGENFQEQYYKDNGDLDLEKTAF